MGKFGWLYNYCSLHCSLQSKKFLLIPKVDCMSFFSTSMDKLKLTGRTLGRVFNSRRVCMHAMHLLSSVAIWPNLELKTRPKQLLGSLTLDIVLPSTRISTLCSTSILKINILKVILKWLCKHNYCFVCINTFNPSINFKSSILEYTHEIVSWFYIQSSLQDG